MDLNIKTSQIYEKILAVAQDEEKLHSLCKVELEKVLDDLPRRILCGDGIKLLGCIFKGLPDSKCPLKRKVIDIVLKTARKDAMTLTHSTGVTMRIRLEIPTLPKEQLVRLSNDCVESIVQDNDVNMIWRDILPDCLRTIASHNTIIRDGTEMTGAEFVTQCFHALCQCNWKERQLVQLAAMFTDLQLHTRPEHKQVVNKLCTYITDIPPETLPPLVHQMLKLCKVYHIEIVLAHLSHYFYVQLYSRLDPSPANSASTSTSIDIEDIVQYSHVELSRCLSTCLYHFIDGPADIELIRKHIKQWPKTQLLRAPFIVDLALAYSSRGRDFKICLDVIKLAIEMRIMDEIRRLESAWARSVLRPDLDVANVLKALTSESANHRQITVMGLIHLAFSLLAVPRVKATAAACWSHARLVLVRLCKYQPETAPYILGQLSKNMFVKQNMQQYNQCLAVLCELTSVSVERCSQLIKILDNCQPLGSYSAKTYEAIRPLIACSTRVRDTLILTCRKGLYSQNPEYRCLALFGFLTVLRYVEISNQPTSSQDNVNEEFSGHSYLSQITADKHAITQGSRVPSRVRNETVCLEVLSILRECLRQDAAVKQLFYTELYGCVKDKGSLYDTILETFYGHLMKYLPQEDNEDASLLLDLCVQEKPTNAVLIEPIGRLLYMIAQFLQDDDSEEMTGSQSASVVSWKKTLADIIEKLYKTNLLALVNMEDIVLADQTPESQMKGLKVQQILQCYEAFIGYLIMKWTPDNQNANWVYKLYKTYNQLLENVKATPKRKKIHPSQAKDTQRSPKKLKTPTKVRPSGQSQNTQKSTQNLSTQKSGPSTQKNGPSTQKSGPSTQKDGPVTQKSGPSTQKGEKSQKSPAKRKAPVKVSNLLKNRAGPFKPLPCLWDMPLCVRVLNLLYEHEVPWSSTEQRNYIRSKRDFHLFALRNIQSALETVDKRADTHILKILEILYNRCIARFQDMCEFDDNTTMGCLELFKKCLSLTLASTLKIDTVLSEITGITDKPGSAALAEILEKIYIALNYLETEGAEEELDLVRRKLLATLVLIAAALLETPVPICIALNVIILKLEYYMRSSKQAEALPLISALLTASSRDQHEGTLLSPLLDKLSAELGVIDQEESSTHESTNSFPAIDSRSGHAVLGQVCAHLGARMRCTEHLVGRARDLAQALLNAVPVHHNRIAKEVDELYKSIILELIRLSEWVSQCAQMRFSIGAGSDKVMGVCVALYSLLAMMVKQLAPDVAKLLRLERLLKRAGKKLSGIIDSLIMFVEAGGSAQEQPNADKVIRETKLIPRIVFQMEQFHRHVLLLGAKTELNYKQYLSLGTARDFKIKAPVLQEILDLRDPAPEEMEDQHDITDADTEVLGSLSDREEYDEDEE